MKLGISLKRSLRTGKHLKSELSRGLSRTCENQPGSSGLGWLALLLCSGWCCPSPEASKLDPGFPEHMSLVLAQSHLRGQTCGITATHRGACSKGPWALAGWASSLNDTWLFGKQLKAQFSFVLREHVETCCMGHGRVC